MLHIPALVALLLLAGCSTTARVDPGSALVGKNLDSAIGLYGPWEQKLTLGDRPTFVWRRRLIEGEAHYYCELYVEVGFRQTVSRSYMQGFPRACQMFDIRYDSATK